MPGTGAHGRRVRITGRVVQSQDAALDGAWARLVKPAASGGSSRFAVDRGARATLRFTGRGVAIVAPMGPGRGKASIEVDGKQVGRVDLQAPDHVQRLLVWRRTWKGSGRHTVRVRVLRTPGRPRVDVDAFLVVR